MSLTYILLLAIYKFVGENNTGFPSGFFTGTGGYLLNLEYRVALLKIERGAILSTSIERLYLSFFSDIGSLWNLSKRIEPSYSFGMELNLIVMLGGTMTISGGVAVGNDRDVIFYWRIGEAF